MTDRRRAGLLGALFISFVAVLSACGGSTPAATTQATPTPESTPAAEATPEAGTPAPVGGATPDLALPSFDLDALSGSLPGVDSYRTSVSVGGEENYRSVVVTKPVLSKEITILDGGEVSTRIIIVGDQAWQADGATGSFESVPSQLAGSMLMLYDPALMLGGFSTVDWSNPAWQVGTEQKNGVQAHHVHIDSTSGIGAVGAIPPGAAVDIWVADAGYMVAWEMTGFANDANISIQVTNVNDPANTVEAPS